MQWFRDAKFGMFIHWGPCVVGGKEISWGRDSSRPFERLSPEPRQKNDPVYDNYYKQFNPQGYDPEQWVAMAQDAGMKYMVLIAKHHDGFCMFDSKLTDYTIMNSPYKQDIVGKFVRACNKAGNACGLYYSTRDWHHPDYLAGDNARYDAYYRGQIEELLTRYGKVDLIWFDSVGGGDWPSWRFDKLCAMMYKAQPGLIFNDRGAGFLARTSSVLSPQGLRQAVIPEIPKMMKGDYDTREGGIGNKPTSREWEACVKTSSGWSWRNPAEYKSPHECIDLLVMCATGANGGGNLLLNFTPGPDGRFPPGQIALARAMGEWTRKYGKALYGTRSRSLLQRTVGRFDLFWRDDLSFREASSRQQIEPRCHALEDQGGQPFSYRQGAGIYPDGGKHKHIDTRGSARYSLHGAQAGNGSEHSSRSCHREEDQRVRRPGNLRHGDQPQGKTRASVPAKRGTRQRIVPGFLSGDSGGGYVFQTVAEKKPWVKVDLGKEFLVTAIHLEGGSGPPQDAPNPAKMPKQTKAQNGMIVEISQDGSRWSRIHKTKTKHQVCDIPVEHIEQGAQCPWRAMPLCPNLRRWRRHGCIAASAAGSPRSISRKGNAVNKTRTCLPIVAAFALAGFQVLEAARAAQPGLQLRYEQPATDWEKQRCPSAMAGSARWCLAAHRRSTFSSMRKACGSATSMTPVRIRRSAMCS